MSYHLCQVASLLKRAFDYARKEMGKPLYYKEDTGWYARGRMVGYGQEGYRARRVNPDADDRFNLEKVPAVKLGTDMGHDLAMVRAGELTIEQMIKMFSMPNDSLLHPENAYKVFYLRAMIYLMYRGVSLSAIHQEETETYHYYIGRRNEVVRVSTPGGHGVETATRKLTLIEAALRKVGIPANEPTIRRKVDDAFGVIWSPVDGRVKASYVEGKSGKLPVIPLNPLFVLEAWDAPSLPREVKIVAKVGGEVGKVSVKPGQMVRKGDELVRLKDTWVDASLNLPCGGQIFE